jgi:hypothetical protein
VSLSKTFNASELMVLVRERIHTKNSSVRRFIVGWVGMVDFFYFRKYTFCNFAAQQSVICATSGSTAIFT